MDIEFWTRALREAEAELEAASTRTALNAAAKKLIRAKAELKRLEGAWARGMVDAAGAALGHPVSRSGAGTASAHEPLPAVSVL